MNPVDSWGLYPLIRTRDQDYINTVCFGVGAAFKSLSDESYQ